MDVITDQVITNLTRCAHRVTMDRSADPAERGQGGALQTLLWQRQSAFRSEGVAYLGVRDLRGHPQREAETAAAVARREAYICGGKITADGLVGEPDVLQLVGDEYMPGLISPATGDIEDAKLHHLVRLALWVDILQRLGLATHRHGFLWSGPDCQTNIDLEVKGSDGDPSPWDLYVSTLQDVRDVLSGNVTTTPASSSGCKECCWFAACRKRLVELDDLTLIPELGRARRDSMVAAIPTVAGLAEIDLTPFIKGQKTSFKGVGSKMLLRFQDRARLITTPGAGPRLRSPIHLPRAPRQIFYDVEHDPIRGLTYLHGFVERYEGQETYVAAFANSPDTDAERDAFAKAISYLADRPDGTVYVYSSYERTTWRRLQQRYPEVCSLSMVETVFARSVDLYSVVRTNTDWPTHDLSIKTLATYLGFKWRDSHPSGAASVVWYDHWVTEGRPELQQRIATYNEDDCRAMVILLDALELLGGERETAILVGP